MLWLIALAGIALRFTSLGRSYWFDELATLVNAGAPDWLTLWTHTAQDKQPPLYNSSTFVWISIFGRGELAVRSLSLIYGLLALLTPWLARTSLSRGEKLLCLLILCALPLPIRYAQEARNYSLLLLMSASCLFLYLECLTSGRALARNLLFGALLLLAASHIFGLLLALSFIAVMIVFARNWIERLSLAVFGAVLGAAIVTPLILGGAGHDAGGHFWITFTLASFIRAILYVFTPVGLLLLGCALAVGWRDGGTAAIDPRVIKAAAPSALMFCGAVAISFNTPILTDRNLIGMLPAFALLIAVLLYRRLTRASSLEAAGLLLLLLLLLAQSCLLVGARLLFVREDFRAIAQQSAQSNRRVCALIPNEHPHLWAWQAVESFYVVEMLGRPDLEPRIVAESELPLDPAGSECRLWADGHPEGSVSVLKLLPQFRQCTDVPLGTPAERTHSVLLSCP